MCRGYTRTLGERIAVFFPKSVLGLLGDTEKNTFLLSISISLAIAWEQYY